MIVYLAGGHICGKYQQFKEYMMIVYLAGAIHGNLKPLWNNIIKSSSSEKELEYKYENFWRGGNQDIGYIMN